MVGILGFGSLIDDPGKELADATAEHREMQTPFLIEFARSSTTRGGAPTLVPVAKGGGTVNATLFVLKAALSEQEAASILWRRETRQVGSDKSYRSPSNPSANRVLVKSIKLSEGIVLYTDFPETGKLPNPSAKQLAELAVCSARNDEVPTELNGISYLIAAKRAGITAPLLPEYEAQVLRITGAKTLKDALAKLESDG